MHRYGVIGTSFRESSTEFQAHLHLAADALSSILPALRGACGFDEVVYLATCNRVDVFYVIESGARPEDDLARFVEFLTARVCRVLDVHAPAVARDAGPEASDRAHFHCLNGEDAARYLFRVASSVDSMVVGEAQILGQVKEAFQRSVELGLAGRHLKRLFDQTFAIAKQIRTRTGLGTGAVSIASLAVHAVEATGVLPDAAVALVGSGPMTRKAAARLAKHGFRNLVFVNRTVEKVRPLAETHHGKIMPLDRFLGNVLPVDVIVTATASMEPLFTPVVLSRLLDRRDGKAPVVIVDLAVPRDTDAALDDDARVRIITMDDLRAISDRNAGDRAARAREAEAFIEQGVLAFDRKLGAQQLAAPQPANRRATPQPAAPLHATASRP